MLRPFLLEGCILFLRIKARTGLLHVGEVAVTEDGGVRVVDLQGLEQMPEGRFLRFGTGVGVVAFSV